MIASRFLLAAGAASIAAGVVLVLVSIALGFNAQRARDAWDWTTASAPRSEAARAATAEPEDPMQTYWDASAKRQAGIEAIVEELDREAAR